MNNNQMMFSSKWLRLSLIIALLVLSGCTEIQLNKYTNMAISNSYQYSTERRNFNSGHLLVKGDGEVLELYMYIDINKFVKDEEACESIRVELPKLHSSDFPITINNPKSYFQECSCVWGSCTEEFLTKGTVKIWENISNGTIGELNLFFPSKSVHKKGLFVIREPRPSLLTEDDNIPEWPLKKQ